MITKAYAATSAALITSPIWSEALHVYSDIMQAASLTVGFIVGVLTVRHYIRQRDKEKK